MNNFLGVVQQIAGVVGTVTSAIGQFQQAQQQASIADYNAAVLRQQANLIREQGKLEKRSLIKRNRAFTSRQIALFAKAGIVSHSGSALEVMSEDAGELELDVLVNDWNTENRARSVEAGVPFQELMADNIRSEGFATAGSTLLTELPDFLPRVFGPKKTV
ncbi:MAG: hypothetical protein ACYTEU_12090 [Planctomycetota bacterium]